MILLRVRTKEEEDYEETGPILSSASLDLAPVGGSPRGTPRRNTSGREHKHGSHNRPGSNKMPPLFPDCIEIGRNRSHEISSRALIISTASLRKRTDPDPFSIKRVSLCESSLYHDLNRDLADKLDP